MFRLSFLFHSQIMPRLPSKSGIRLRKEQEAYVQDRNHYKDLYGEPYKQIQEYGTQEVRASN